MKLFSIAVAAIILGMSVGISPPSETVSRASGGTVRTELGHGLYVNKESSLEREWITVHDDSIPVDIMGTVGVKTVYNSGTRYSSGGYQYEAEYSINAEEDLSAIEVRFLTFDIWGEHSRILSVTEIVDIAAETTKKFVGKWSVYSENEISELYASVAFIAQIRTKSGKVFKTNPEFIIEQARKFSKKFSEEDLEPNPEKK